METIPTPPNPFIAEAGTLVIPSFEEWFYLPGDWVLYLLASRVPAVAEFFGVEASDYGGTLAAILAWICWVVLAVASIAVTSAIRRFDRAVTGGVLDAVAELRRHMRMSLVFAQYRLKLRQQRREPTMEVGETNLGRDELRVLELHAKLAPGFALSTSDVAHELGARGYEIRTALERLQKLKLLQATVGGLDGETAYTLTAAGRTLLQIRRAEPRMA